MIKRMIVMLLLVGLVLGGVYGFQVLKTNLIAKALADYAAVPKTVSAIQVDYQNWQPEMTAVGTLKAAQGVDIAPETAGIIDKLNFESGQDVAAGDPLIQLRLDDAASRLNQFQAAAQLAQLTYQRDRRQFTDKAVSQATLDTDLANLKSAEAQVQAQQTLIDEKTVRAPFAGRLGIRQVNTGQYLNPGTAIVSLQALDTLYVDFYLPQQVLGVLAVNQPMTVKVDAVPGHIFPGTISAIDAQVDTGTRNVKIRATLDNTGHKLLPGMYATIAVNNGTAQKLLTVPQTAITFNAYGDTVFRVDSVGKDAKGNPVATAHQSFVKTGATRGDQIAVLSGVTAGQMIVTAGQSKLSNGTAVIVDNTVQPSNNADPSVMSQ
jgi:membrane fusion protein (multidrug efflux system)